MVIYVIGFIGSDRMAVARAASEKYGIPLYDLNAEIKERDGRSIRRMVITMGDGAGSGTDLQPRQRAGRRSRPNSSVLGGHLLRR